MNAASSADDLVVVVVNYRTGALVIDCLASLEAEVAAHPGVRVRVVDNASGDASADLIERAIVARGWSDWASVDHAPVNGGFAYGNNRAVRAAMEARGGDAGRMLFWLLNPDTVVRRGAVSAILGFLAAHPQAGAIGTAIEDEAGAAWPYAFRFHSLAGEVESALRIRVVTRWLADRTPTRRMGADAEPVDWVSGASVVVRGAVFAQVGLIDEGYFLYFEETDFFRKVAAAGWERWYVPGAVVQHISGQSTGLTASDAAARRVPAYWFASRRRYLVRNHGRLYAIVADLIAIAGLCGWRARCRMRRRPHGGSPYFLRDFIRHSSLLRRDVQANAQLARQSGPAGLAHRALLVLLG